MTEGGTFPWKRQIIDQSRGPAGTYDSVHKSLPDLPDGVAWQQNEKTREWTLVRVDQQAEKDKFLYRLERTTAWNPRTGREQLTVMPVLKTLHNSDDTVATAGSDNDNEDGSNDPDAPPVPVLGKDYLVHTVVPSDTFSGLCLRYKIKPVTLRRVNHFSGTNLALAPSKLLIPLGANTAIENLRLQDTSSPEYKMQVILSEFPHLASMERKAYLEMNDWDVQKTLEEIQGDMEFEKHNTFPTPTTVKPLEVDA